MKVFNKRYHPPGTAPGTLAEHLPETPPTIHLVDYTATDFHERELASAEECRAFLDAPTTTWIHIQGSADRTGLTHLGELFGLPELALEDVINRGQRAKVDVAADLLFLVLHLPVLDGEGNARTHQVSLFVGAGFVMTFCDGSNDPFHRVRKRLKQAVSRLRTRSSDYLAYALVDTVVDAAFPVLEHYGERIEDLEEALLGEAAKTTLSRIHHLRRELLLLRRALWPQRNVLSDLLQEELATITEETRTYLHDCYDHTVQIIDLLESYREMTSNLLDVYLSSVSNRLNESMRLLTIIATVFIPLTFVVGLYGMNFAAESDSPWAMPELRAAYGYPILWLVMIAMVAGMLWLFRRKHWL
jgi:magnesium transporter